MKYTHIIWDFNGTILDDLMPSIVSTNVMLEKRGIPVMPDVESYRRVFGFPVRDYYESIGFDFTKESYDDLSVEWVDLYLENTKNPKLMPGVFEALEYFKSLGLTQLVISACESRMLNSQLEELGVRGYFDEIIGLDNIKAGGKGALAKAWRGNNPLAKALFIGDTTHDAEVAAIAESECVLYLGGHHDKERLSACGRVFESFSELYDIVK